MAPAIARLFIAHRASRIASSMGHTLIELVISMAITSILVAAIGSAIMLAAKAIPDPDDPAVPTLAATETAHELAAEIQFALAFAERSPRAVEFTVPSRDADNSPETIRYEWSGVAGDPLTRRYNGGPAVNVVDSVMDFALEYDTVVATETVPTENESLELELISYDSPSNLGDAHVHFGNTGITVFSDDFNDGVITGWTSIEAGTLQESGGVLQTLDGINTHAHYAIDAGAAWTDYVFSAEIRSVDNDVSALTFRIQDSSNFYRFSQGFGDDAGWDCQLRKYVAGATTELAPPVLNYGSAYGQVNDVDAWYTLKVVVSGNNIKCYIDDVLKFDVIDLTYASGTAGLWIKWQEDAEFDNALVTSSDPAVSRQWWGEYFKPTLPADTIEWSVTRVRFVARADDDPAATKVQLRLPEPDLTPGATVLGAAILNAAELTPVYTWIEKPFLATGLSPDEGLSLTFTNSAGRSAQLQYQTGSVAQSGIGLVSGSPGWGSLATSRSLLFYVYGTYTTPGTKNVAHTYLTGVQIAIQSGAEGPSGIKAGAALLHRPEIDQ